MYTNTDFFRLEDAEFIFKSVLEKKLYYYKKIVYLLL